MPKVYLTADQRLAARYDAMAQRLADYKCRNRLRNRDIGRALGIRDETVSRLLGGDRTVRLNMETLFKLEDMAKEVSYHEQDPK